MSFVCIVSALEHLDYLVFHTLPLFVPCHVDVLLDSSSDAAAKERLHHSLALPTSYTEPKSAPVPSTTETETSKPVQATAAAESMSHPPPCRHHMEHMQGDFSFGSIFGPILAEAAHDVFGAEQIISSQMHDMFEDIMTGPAIPKVLDILEGAATSAATLPTLLPPFLRGFIPSQPVASSTVSSAQPVFDVIITSSSNRHADVSDDESAQPTWEQEVVISSSDPSRLQQLADMFEQQLQGSSASLGRRLKGVQEKVQPADVAQVLLGAARKLRAAHAL